MIPWWPLVAGAAESEGPEPAAPRLSLQAVAESWQDPAIGTVYASGTLLAGVGLEAPVIGPVSLGVDAAYKGVDSRAAPELARFELIPITAIAAWNAPFGEGLTGFAGLGPSLVVFNERHPPVRGIGVTSGLRPGFEIRAGARMDLALLAPAPMPPSRTVGVQAVELVAWLARRSTLPREEGFLLGAWRGSLGLGLRF